MELMNIPAIALLFGVSPKTVRERWAHRPDFPAPRYAPSIKRRQWAREDLERWASPAGQKCPALIL